jgi:hypothetical protein
VIYFKLHVGKKVPVAIVLKGETRGHVNTTSLFDQHRLKQVYIQNGSAQAGFAWVACGSLVLVALRIRDKSMILNNIN